MWMKGQEKTIEMEVQIFHVDCLCMFVCCVVFSTV